MAFTKNAQNEAAEFLRRAGENPLAKRRTVQNSRNAMVRCPACKNKDYEKAKGCPTCHGQMYIQGREYY